MGVIFKKFHMKTILKSKINLIRKTLNFASIYNEAKCRASLSPETIPLKSGQFYLAVALIDSLEL
jgi:hypothetical protein